MNGPLTPCASGDMNDNTTKKTKVNEMASRPMARCITRRCYGIQELGSSGIEIRGFGVRVAIARPSLTGQDGKEASHCSCPVELGA